MVDNHIKEFYTKVSDKIKKYHYWTQTGQGIKNKKKLYPSTALVLLCDCLEHAVVISKYPKRERMNVDIEIFSLYFNKGGLLKKLQSLGSVLVINDDIPKLKKFISKL